MSRRVPVFVLGTLLFWAVIAYPALNLWGRHALIYSAAALILCMLPTIGTLVWGDWALGSSPEQQVIMVLGATGMRLTVVLGGGLAVYGLVDYFRELSFWGWLLVFYLFTLAVETTLIVLPKEKPVVGRAAQCGDAPAHG